MRNTRKKSKEFFEDNSEEMVECSVCYAEYECEELIYSCDCEVLICNDCLFTWSEQLIKNGVLNQSLSWKCPQQNPTILKGYQKHMTDPMMRKVLKGKTPICSRYSFDKVLDKIETGRRLMEGQINKELYESLMAQTFKHYLVHADDIRSCPKKQCQGAGFVEVNSLSEKIECLEPLQCRTCQHKWMDPLQQKTQGMWILNLKNEVTEYFSRMAENIVKVVVSKPCPKCGILIQKNGGCSHVGCSKCGFQFCWDCLGSYLQYRHEKGVEYQCSLAIIPKVTVVLMIILSVIYRLKFTDYMQEHENLRQFIYVFIHCIFIDIWLILSLGISSDVWRGTKTLFGTILLIMLAQPCLLIFELTRFSVQCAVFQATAVVYIGLFCILAVVSLILGSFGIVLQGLIFCANLGI